MTQFKIPLPTLQIEFAYALESIRSLYLNQAIANTISVISIEEIDRELAALNISAALSKLGQAGIRGERIFAVPTLLAKNPRLLGYYRLLYGYSQKEFYKSATGLSRYQNMEKKGSLSQENCKQLEALCGALAQTGKFLVDGLSATNLSSALLHELSLLTLGPQFRGGANVRKGAAGIAVVFEKIREIVEPHVIEVSDSAIKIENAAGRDVHIQFAPDPDIIILEQMDKDELRKAIAIEVKAGSDFSNIHNRVGEAEKSHQKAKNDGFVECWTIFNVDNIDLDVASSESPSTNRFYRISALEKPDSSEYRDFRNRIISLTGIRSP